MRIVRYDDETEEEYQAFVAWYLSSPRKAPKDPDLASRNDWTIRAMSLDVAAKPIEETKPHVQESETTLQRLLMLEAHKFLLRSENAPGMPTLSPNELIRLAQIVFNPKAPIQQTDLPAENEPEAETDFSQFSNEELDVLAKAAKLRG